MPSSEVFFLFTVCWRYAFPPIRRRAAGGEITPSEGVCIAAFGGPGKPVFTGENKRGRDTKVSLPLLTPRPFLWTRLPSVARLKCEGPTGAFGAPRYNA